MKPHRILFSILIALSFLTIGCATKVPIQRLVSATHDMGSYRSLAVASVEPYRFSLIDRTMGQLPDLSGSSPVVAYPGYQLFTERSVATRATGRLVAGLDETGFFDLLLPGETDMYGTDFVAIRDAGYAAFLRTKVSRMGVEEYLFAKKLADGTNSYQLRQKVEMALAIEVIDLESAQVVYQDTFQERDERNYTLDPEEGVVVFAPPLLPLFEQMADDAVSRTVRALAPRRVSVDIPLMKNKPLLPASEEAYVAASRGEWAAAYHRFLSAWEDTQHIPSGYNAALIVESFGRRDEAFALMQRIWELTGDRKAGKQMDRMKRYMEEQDRARSQY